MAEYFLTKNQDGTDDVQISDRHRPYILVKSGRLTESDFVTGGGISRSRITVTGVPPVAPIMFFRSPNPNDRATCVCLGVLPNGGYAFDINKWHNLVITQYVDYFVFDRVSPASTSNQGLEVFDEHGNPVFDDDSHFLNIKQIVPMGSEDGLPVYGQDIVFSMPVSISGIAAVGKSMFRRYVLHYGGDAGAVMSECAWLQGGNVNINWVPIFDDPIEWSGLWTGNWQSNCPTDIYIADVSDYPVPFSL